MHGPEIRRFRPRQSGQTLIIAILILGVLLVLGLVFAGIVNRGILQTGSALRRTQSTDLAEAGIRFAHSQLLNSDLGADWRPTPTPIAIDPAGLTRDPDAWYLRPAPPAGGSFLRDRNGNLLPAGADRGGPDGLGPFTRVEFERGRALIRVLYNPGQLGNFGATTLLREPAKARGLIQIESIGRPGRVVPNDPTTLTTEAVQITNFTNQAQFDQGFGAARAQANRNVETRKLVAFASIGIIEHGWFVTNKFRVSRPAEIGSLSNSVDLQATAPTVAQSSDLGVDYEGQRVRVPTILGGQIVGVAGSTLTQGPGSFFSNADVVVHGDVRTTLDSRIGDLFAVAGSIRPANAASRLQITRLDATGANTFNLFGNTLTSSSSQFGTVGGVLRDGRQAVDTNGFARSISRKEPPSFQTNDPATGLNRYAQITRNSGVLISGGQFIGRNSGQWGHGRGIYVDSAERGNFSSETARELGDPAKSLVRDWLNPNNLDSVAWRGPFYIPVATYVELRPNGFRIIRDPRSANRFWRRQNGTPTGSSEIRYRLLYPDRFGRKYIINSIEHADLIDQDYNVISVAAVQQRGWEFNGVLFFEGDVRVRGVIPTFEQLTFVSQGTIYIEGSIVKGTVGQFGQTLATPSPATLMLAAKDYIAVNTTMFFGPAPGESVSPKRTDRLPNTPNPIELDLSERDTLTFQTQFIRNPFVGATGVPNPDPRAWQPFASEYVQQRGGGSINPHLLLSHSADNSGPSFIRMSSTPFPFLALGTDPVEQPYVFGSDSTRDFNVEAGGLFSAGNPVTLYGLTNTTQTAFPRFENASFPLVGPAWTYVNRRLGGLTPGTNSPQVYAVDDETRFTIATQTPSNYTPQNYALARIAVQPADIRIEAALYAEEGSFFVIPGPAYNLNPDDTRARFNQQLTALGNLGAAQADRYSNFGARPETPFFGEPLNVRISIVGALSENMPVSMSERAEWQRRWGWMPRFIGASGNPAGSGAPSLTSLPAQHVPTGWAMDFGAGAPSSTDARYAPNLTVTYDPALALGVADFASGTPIRRTPEGWTLPPMPRLPVSPTLAYFGEVNP